MNFIIKLFLNAIAVVIVAYILPGVHLGSGMQADNTSVILNALILTVVLSVLNASIKPLLIFLTIPATIFSLGLFLLVINAIIIEIAAWIMKPEFAVDSFWWALLFSILLTIVNGILERLAIKSDKRDDTMQVFDKDGNRVA
jgi:putative membrane protein